MCSSLRTLQQAGAAGWQQGSRRQRADHVLSSASNVLHSLQLHPGGGAAGSGRPERFSPVGAASVWGCSLAARCRLAQHEGAAGSPRRCAAGPLGLCSRAGRTLAVTRPVWCPFCSVGDPTVSRPVDSMVSAARTAAAACRRRRRLLALPPYASMRAASPLNRLQKVVELPPMSRGCHVITRRLLEQVRPIPCWW